MAVGKRLWSYVRAALFMARNGVLSNKRKLLLTMHLLGASTKRKAVTSLLSTSHHAHHGTGTAYALRRRDYEFSCTNSPAPAAASSSSRRRLAYFPCLGAVPANDDYDYGYGYGSLSLPDAEPVARIEHYASASASAAAASSPAPGEEEDEEEYAYACAASASASASPALLLPGAASGDNFSVRVSNYSSEDDEAACAASDAAVDADAEEFIRRFYDQLRRQNTVALLPYPYYTQQESVAAA